MNRNELISQIAHSTGMSKANINEVLDAFIDTVTNALKSGDEIRLAGFFTLSVADRKEMKGRNPRTGEEITIPSSKRPKFKAGTKLVEAVN